MMLSLCIIVLALLHCTRAVERSKFRTCAQTAFCARNRALTGREAAFVSGREVRVDSPELLRLGVMKQRAGSSPLFADFEVLRNAVLRFTLLERHPNRYDGPREEVLVNDLKGQPAITNREDTVELNSFSYGFNNELSVRIQKNPFRVDVLKNDKLLVGLNRRNKLNFEHIRKRAQDVDVPEKIPSTTATKPKEWNDELDGVWEPPLEDNPAFKGRWEEKFGSFTDKKKFGPTSIGVDITFDQATHVYGIPEHATTLSLQSTKGKEPYRLYNLDVFEYELDNNMALYGSVPLMLAHSAEQTVGLLWLNAAETWIDVDDRDANKPNSIDTHWFSESGQLELYILPGPTPADVLKQYAHLTGTTPLPPKFSIAYHQCKWNYRSEREVAEVNAGFDHSRIPMDVIWLDIEHTDGKRYFTWDKNNFPTPEKLLGHLKSHARRMVTIVDPHIKTDNNYIVHKEATAADVYVKQSDGKPYEESCWPGQSSWVDFMDARARSWWSDRFLYDNYKGSSNRLFVWNDMNEPSVFSGPEVTMHKDVLHKGGNIEHRDVHNLFGQVMHRATWEGLLKRDQAVGQAARRPFLLTRAFFAGSQRYGAVWTGDNGATWEHLAASMPMLLSLSVTGIAFGGADVGGFFGNADPELLTRWYQAAAYQPFFREHGHLDTRRKEPFLFDDPYQFAMREALHTRYRLLPFWYTLFEECSRTGMPPMRPMFLEYPSDIHLFAEEQQFMLGSALLVRPVVKQGEKAVEVLLPGGESQLWFDRRRGGVMKGGKRARMDVSDLVRDIPVFQKGGTILAERWRARRSSEAMRGDPYTLVVAMDQQGQAKGELYMDDGETFDFERGCFARRRFELVLVGSGVLSLRNVNAAGNALANCASGSDTRWQQAKIERIVLWGITSAIVESVVNRGTNAVIEYRDVPMRNAGKTVRLTLERLSLNAIEDVELVIKLRQQTQQPTQ